MADDTIRLAGINIPITTSYNSSGLKQAMKDVAKLGVTVDDELNEVIDQFNAVQETFNTLTSSLSGDSADIQKGIRQVSNAFISATKTANALEKSLVGITEKTIEQNNAFEKLNNIKNQLEETQSGLSILGINISDVEQAKKELLTYQEIAKKGLKEGYSQVEISDAKYYTEELNKYISQSKEVIKVEGELEKSAQKLISGREKVTAQVLSLASATNTARNAVTSLAQKQERLNETTEKERLATEEARAEIIKAIEETQNLGDSQEELSQKTEKSSRSFKKSMQEIAATIYTIRRLISAFKSLGNSALKLVEASSSWVENLNLLEVTFSENSEAAKEFVDTVANNFGLDKNAIAGYVSTFKQMANAMGQAAETGRQMSEVLTLVGLDVASLRNVDIATAISDLTSAIAGQVKPVRKYGFDITQQSLDELLKQAGLGGSSATLTQTQKQLARTILLIKQSKDAWGDMAKTINTFSNQQRVLNDLISTASRSFGNLLVGTIEVGDTFEEAYQKAGIATKILWNLNGAMLAVNQVLSVLIPETTEFSSSIAAGNEDALSSFEDIEDAVSGTLASFDKFNTLQQGDGSASDAMTTALEQLLSSETSKYMTDFTKRLNDINMYAKEISDNFLKWAFPDFAKWAKENEGAFADWFKQTGQSLDTLFPWLNPLVEALKSISSVVLDFLKQLPTFLTATLNIISDILYILNPILEDVAKLINWLAENNMLAEALGLILGTMIAIKGIKFFGEMQKGIQAIGVAFTKLSTTMIGQLNMLQIAASAFIGVLSFALFNKIFTEIGNQFGIAAKGIVSALAIVASAVTVAAIAWMAYQGAMTLGVAVPMIALAVGFGAAAIKAQIEAAKGYANGGFQTGGMFYAGESGPEWVGRQGNTATIINDKQMSDIMTEAVAEGVAIGNQYNGAQTNRNSGTIAVVNMDGKRLFEVVEENGKRIGKVFAKA